DRLISDVSDASRLDAEMSRVSAGPVDVVPILRTLQELDEATRDDDDPRLEVVAPPSGVTVWAVEDRLVQVLRNLIGNAQSFSPPNGRITARVRDAGGMAELSVEDEGPGIPDAKLEHIFDRFYSERPQNESFGQHSGLGLSISRQIVEALHGQISAENRRDANGKVLGARFIVRLRKA
ncbi:MAG TPA: ATP-binding protein, partial [Rhodopila sp.]|nr:ATP-binding protein [Rhodopila sp.]